MARRHLDRVRRAAERLRHAEDQLAAAVVDARDSGETLRDIAASAGMTHQHVDRLIHRVEQRTGSEQPLEE